MGQEDETSYYVKMQKDDGSYYYVSMNGEGHELYVDMEGKRYINLDKQEEEECYLMKKQSEDGSYYYVPMKGGAPGHGGKLYEDVKDKRPHRQVPKPPESDQDTSEGLIYENLNKASSHQDEELYEKMEGNTEGQDNPEELYIDMEPEKGDNPSEFYMDMEAEKGEDPSELYMDMAAEEGEDPSELYTDMEPGVTYMLSNYLWSTFCKHTICSASKHLFLDLQFIKTFNNTCTNPLRRGYSPIVVDYI